MTTTGTKMDIEGKILEALQALASVCDGATSQDERGFNGGDTGFGKSLAAQATLTPKQISAGYNMLRKYIGQLEGFGITLPEAQEVQEYVKQRMDGVALVQSSIPQGSIELHSSGGLAVMWPKNTPNFQKKLDAARKVKENFRNTRFDPSLPGWLMPFEALDLVLNLFPELDLDPRLAELKKSADLDAEADKRILSEEKRALLQALGDLSQPLPDGRHLYQHQIDIIHRMIETPYHGFINAHDVGLGKTLSALMVAKAYQQYRQCAVYILATPSAMEMWRRECEATGVYAEIFSWGKVPMPPEMTEYVFLADEAHKAMSFKSLRGKAYQALAENALAVFPLTGTPLPNSRPANLLPLLASINHPIAKDRKHYEYRYCGAYLKQIGRNQVYDTTGSTNLKELYEKTRDGIDYKKKCDCVDMPKFQRLMVDVVLSASGQKRYQDTLKRLSDEHEERVQQKMRLLVEEFPEHVKLVIEETLKAVQSTGFEIFLVREVPTLGKKAYHEFNEELANGALKPINRSIFNKQEMPEDLTFEHPMFADLYKVNDIHTSYFEDVARQGDAIVALGQIRHAGEIAKIEETVERATEILEEGDQVVIFALHVDAAHLVAEDLAKELGISKPFAVVDGSMDVKNRQVVMDAFQVKGDATTKSIYDRVFIATYGAASESITLTESHHIILMSRDFTPKALIQVEGRIDRVSQQNDMTSHWMRYGVVDALWDRILDNKEENIELILKGKKRAAKNLSIYDVAEEMVEDIFSSLR